VFAWQRTVGGLDRARDQVQANLWTGDSITGRANGEWGWGGVGCEASFANETAAV
jgi:hypothetical protein